MPGGGGMMTAADLALFYQGLIAQSRNRWRTDLESGSIEGRTARALGDYRDPIFGVTVNRGLGVVVAGGDGRGELSRLRQDQLGAAFGHGGAGGQIGWADPATGISIGYCTNGFDRNDLRQGRRGVAISSLAAVCAA